MARKARPSSVSPAVDAVSTPAPAAAQQMGCLALVARMTWLAAGNLAFLVSALYVLKAGRFSGADVAFWAIAVGLVVVRYLDVTRLGGYTADGKPATVADWRSYTLKLSAVAVVLWALAHAAGRALA